MHEVLSLPSSDFTIPSSLFYNSELVYAYRTGFVASAQLKFEFCIAIFLTLYNMSLLLQFNLIQNGIRRGKVLQLAEG
jgi:hypothetical protein